ncbi:MAG: tyrosine-type recombinase/integrase, partial [Porphyrobacter sp.]|nr:tyrosine-type recombinase/integrase [Porphyrobacter sp.]
YPTVSLSKARDKAAGIAGAVQEGRDPIAERRKGREKQTTFRECAEAFIEANKAGWRNEKHAAQWTSTLEKWAYPKIGGELVASIDRNAIEAVLTQPVAAADDEPLWIARHETATRVRQRIEKVLDYATARKFRTGENPAGRGVLEMILPAVPKAVRKAKHHAALPYAEAPAFMAALRERAGTAARALEFLILTAARSGEVRLADWSEIDFERALWTIPEERMKAGREHTVPLSRAALAILSAIPKAERTGLIFPGSKPDKAQSDMTLAAVLKRMKRDDITVHGFRSTFRDWAGETTSHPRDVIEHALAHGLKDKTEAAYARGSQLEKRKRLMDDWVKYLDRPAASADVVSINGARCST